MRKRKDENLKDMMVKRGKAEKTILLLATVLILCITTISFVGCRNNNDKGYGEQPAERTKSLEDHYVRQEDETEADYSDVYPYYGMREEMLKSCALGEPASVELCRDFWKLVPRARYKTYVFGVFGQPLSGKFTVRYRWHYSNRYDDYTDLPAENGYVDWGWFVDSDGIRYDVDRDGVEVHEYPSEQNKVKTSEEEDSRRESDDTKIDPDDHDIEAYYEDNKDIYVSYEDAWDDY